MIALCSVLCSGQNATDMAEFAKAKEPFLREFLSLKNGLPSHDTFSRLFRLLDPAKFGAAFQRFMVAFSQPLNRLQMRSSGLNILLRGFKGTGRR